MPVVDQKIKKQLALVAFMLKRIHHRKGSPRKGITVVNKIYEISGKGCKVRNEINIEQELSIIFTGIDCQRQSRKQDEQSICIKDGCGIESDAVVTQL